MSRYLEWDDFCDMDDKDSFKMINSLAAEVDELRGKLDALRAEADPQALVICHMQGRAEGDEVITKLLAMLKPGKPPCDCITEIGPRCSCMNQGDAANVEAWWTTMCHYRRACDIAGRTE